MAEYVITFPPYRAGKLDEIEAIFGGKSAKPSQRPTWRQSEIDVGKSLDQQGFRSQISFKERKEVPYGTKGSTRPEYFKEGVSVEVKNYNVETTQGRNNLDVSEKQSFLNK